MWLRGSSGFARGPARPASLLTPRADAPPSTQRATLGLLPVHHSRGVLPAESGHLPRLRPSEDDPRAGRRAHPFSEASAAKRARASVDDRAQAIATIFEVVRRAAPLPAILAAVLAEEGSLCPASSSIRAMVAKKATATLQRRASSLRLYADWLSASGVADDLIFVEPTVYRYLRELVDGECPPTRPGHFLSSLNFIDGVFGFDMKPVRSSSRVQGLCADSLRRNTITQRRPLSVDVVKVLERIVSADAGSGNPDGIYAGTALFAVYSRCRVGDLCRCAVEPTLDLTDGGGFVETFFLEHKSAKPGSRRALPIVAPVLGLTSKWACEWMAARSAAGLDAARAGTLVPARSTEGRWLDIS